VLSDQLTTVAQHIAAFRKEHTPTLQRQIESNTDNNSTTNAQSINDPISSNINTTTAQIRRVFLNKQKPVVRQLLDDDFELNLDLNANFTIHPETDTSNKDPQKIQSSNTGIDNNQPQ
jgi:hypothetical protein